jgi:TolA-binding protein
MGCHRYEGFDRETDTLAGARQQIGQLEDQIRANEKQIREDEAASGTDEEIKKFLAHAQSLRVTNSLLAARVDQMNLQAKYLMQDQDAEVLAVRESIGRPHELAG